MRESFCIGLKARLLAGNAPIVDRDVSIEQTRLNFSECQHAQPICCRRDIARSSFTDTYTRTTLHTICIPILDLAASMHSMLSG